MAASLDSKDGDLGFQIAPMIDVVFVLMLFFMATVGARVQERELHAQLPAPGGGSGVTPLIIQIHADGSVSMNEKVYATAEDHDLPALRAILNDARRTFGEQDPVIIQPAPATLHERIMEVLNAASAAKIAKVTLG